MLVEKIVIHIYIFSSSIIIYEVGLETFKTGLVIFKWQFIEDIAMDVPQSITLDWTHRLQRCFHFWNHSRKFSFLVLLRTFSVFAWMSKMEPLSANSGNKYKRATARSGESGFTRILNFAKNFLIESEQWAGALS